jgi:DNA-binding XRE family transcriptional regulator
MVKSLSEIMKGLPRARRERIEAEAAREVAEIMSLGQVRKAFEMSQETLAKELDMEQESVSRIERRADLLLSTMRKYVAAMGGDLKLIAEFPNRAPIQIQTFDAREVEHSQTTQVRAKRSEKRGARKEGSHKRRAA